MFFQISGIDDIIFERIANHIMIINNMIKIDSINLNNLFPSEYYHNIEFKEDIISRTNIKTNLKLFCQEIINMHFNVYSHIINYIHSPTYQSNFDKIVKNLYLDSKSDSEFKLTKDDIIIEIKKLYVPIYLHDDKMLSLMIYLYLDIKLYLIYPDYKPNDYIITELNQILDDMIYVETDNLNIKNKILNQHIEYVGNLYVSYDYIFNNSIIKLLKDNEKNLDQYEKNINLLQNKFNKWFNLV